MCPECRGNLLDGNHRVETFKLGNLGINLVVCPCIKPNEEFLYDSIKDKKVYIRKEIS